MSSSPSGASKFLLEFISDKLSGTDAKLDRKRLNILAISIHFRGKISTHELIFQLKAREGEKKAI